MKILLFFIPVLATISGFLIYRLQSAKKQIFRLDLVQFIYLFVLAPTMFVWLKSFLFYLLRKEIDLKISATEIFIIDTAFSMVSFIIVIAIAIHSLTKTFWLRRHADEDFDIYHLSEYFHLWWSHIALWVGLMLLLSFLSIVNVFVPLDFGQSKLQFYSLLILGLICGLVLFLVIRLSDAADVLQNSYMRLMKLTFVFFFVVHVGFYFIFDPDFSMNRIAYWLVFSIFFSAVFISTFFEKRVKSKKLKKMLIHRGWGENKNIQVLNVKKEKHNKTISHV